MLFKNQTSNPVKGLNLKLQYFKFKCLKNRCSLKKRNHMPENLILTETNTTLLS